jgi:hypothetical protein
MDRPDCHAPRRCVVVSVYLASLADTAALPRCPGVSTRALRSALRMMCRIAQSDGTMRYGLRASKLAVLCEYSVATIHRAERYLIEHGYIERVRIGGGRLSTHWRIVVERLAPPDSTLPAQPQSPPSEREDAPGGTQPRRPRWFRRPTAPAASNAGTTICADHGGDGGMLSNGQPRCPQCRRRRDSMTAGPAP